MKITHSHCHFNPVWFFFSFIFLFGTQYTYFLKHSEKKFD